MEEPLDGGGQSLSGNYCRTEGGRGENGCDAAGDEDGTSNNKKECCSNESTLKEGANNKGVIDDGRHEGEVGESSHGNDDDDDDDDDEDEEGETMPSDPIISALLRRLGATSFDRASFGPFSGRNNLHSFIAGLSDSDEEKQLASVADLCDIFVGASEESLSGLPMGTIVASLLRLAQNEHNSELVLLSLRALTYYMDALPQAGAVVVAKGGVGMLCNRLLAIEYIDVAEQSLLALEKLSVGHSTAVLQAGGLTASLTYLDFFHINVQRVAVSLAANLCSKVRSRHSPIVVDVVPVLSSLFEYQDKKIVEKTVVAFSHLVDAFHDSPSVLSQLAANGLSRSLLALIADHTVNPTTFHLAVKSLAVLCRACPGQTEILLDSSVVNVLLRLLGGEGYTAEGSVHGMDSQSLPRHSTEITCQLLCLTAELFPTLPNTSSVKLASKGRNVNAGRRIVKRSHRREDAATSSHKAERRDESACIQRDREANTPTDTQEFSQKNRQIDMQVESQKDNQEEAHKKKQADTEIERQAEKERTAKHPELFSLMPLLLSLFSSAIGPNVRLIILNTLLRLVHAAAPDQLGGAQTSTSLAALISSLLTANEGFLLVKSLQLCEMLLTKMPEGFSQMLVREGTFYDLERLKSNPITTTGWPEAATGLITNEFRGDEKPGLVSSDQTSKAVDQESPSQPPPAENKGLPARKPSTGSEIKSDDYSIQKWIRNAADRILLRYTDVLQREVVLNSLLRLAEQLKECQGPANQVLANLSAALSETEGGLTTFEIEKSRLDQALLSYFTSPDDESIRLARCSAFCTVFFHPSLSDHENEQNHPINCLLARLHELLGKLEQFPIYIHEVIGGGGDQSAFGSHLRVLLQPIKVNFAPVNQHESRIKPKSASALIEPLLKMEMIEDFLWPLVAFNQSEHASQPSQSETSSSANEVENVSANELLLLEQPELNKKAPRLALYLNGQLLNRTMTLFHAIGRYGQGHNRRRHLAGSHRAINSSPHTLTYAVYDEELHHDYAQQADTPWHTGKSVQASTRKQSSLLTEMERAMDRCRCCEGGKQSRRQGEREREKGTEGEWEKEGDWEDEGDEERNKESPVSDVLRLLNILAWIASNQSRLTGCKTNVNSISPLKFQNMKLTAKLRRQLQDTLSVASGNFPQWCDRIVKAHRFLFSLDMRILHMQLASFGTSRALMTLQQQHLSSPSQANEAIQLARLQRKKVTIERSDLLNGAKRLLDETASSRAVLEVEYQDEVGTGLGPTLEFFALSSRELQTRSLGLWRYTQLSHAEDDPEIITSLTGLYPRPVPIGSALDQELPLFKMLGQLMARALWDSRLLDIPLSPAFYHWLLGTESDLDIDSLLDVDPGLHQSLSRLKVYSDHVRAVKRDPNMCNQSKDSVISSLTVDGEPIESLYLDFTLPGYPEIELKANGESQYVNADNIDEYISLVVDFSLTSGVREQMMAVIAGFNSVLSLEALKGFGPDEIGTLLCGVNEKWDMNLLVLHTKPDHGYTHSSHSVRWLLEIMAHFDTSQQRRFLQFITGSPHLPVGGLKALSPRLTIVRRGPTPPLAADDYLPSVMTCVNYLKLPDYSSKAILERQLHLAMNEGRSRFYLS